MSQVKIPGHVHYRDVHAGDESMICGEFTPRQIYETLQAHDPGCECCLPQFIADCGITAFVEGKHLHWFMKAWGANRLGIKEYRTITLGNTEDFE